MGSLKGGYICKSASIFLMLFIDLVINGLMDMVNQRYVPSAFSSLFRRCAAGLCSSSTLASHAS
jgi:hypothetical protein